MFSMNENDRKLPMRSLKGKTILRRWTNIKFWWWIGCGYAVYWFLWGVVVNFNYACRFCVLMMLLAFSFSSLKVIFSNYSCHWLLV
jgi:hypothetical protein